MPSEILESESAARAWIEEAFAPTAARWAQLDRFAAMLVAENAQQNLIAASTIPTMWVRHIADSAQLLALDTREGEGLWIDLGSGPGLPGLVVAILSARPMLLVESRKRLKPEFASLPQSEIETAARNGKREDLLEEVQHVSFAHSGDAMPIDPLLAAGADVLVHDATFLNAADRREPIHATTEEALDVARRANVATLVLYHLSIRYDRATALPTLRDQVKASGFAGDCWLLDEDNFIEMTKNEERGTKGG